LKLNAGDEIFLIYKDQSGWGKGILKDGSAKGSFELNLKNKQ